MRVFVLSSAAVLVLCAAGCGQGEEARGSASSALLNVADDPAGVDGVLVARRPRVKGDTGWPADKRAFSATAAVFGTRCVITATHVAKAAGVDVSKTLQFFAGADAQYDANQRFEAAPKATVFNGVSTVKIFGTASSGTAPDAGQPEIAIVKVNKAFPALAKYKVYPPAAVNPKVGATVTVAGYGLGNPWAAAALRTSTRGTSDLQVFDVYGKTGTSFRVGDPAKPVTKGVAPGDSGGPVTSGGKLVGVSSKGWAYSPTKALPNAGQAVVASVPQALSTLTAAERAAINAACGTKLAAVGKQAAGDVTCAGGDLGDDPCNGASTIADDVCSCDDLECAIDDTYIPGAITCGDGGDDGPPDDGGLAPDVTDELEAP